MSMSFDMVKAYVKDKLAKAVSGGILKGRTESNAGHDHRFAILYDDSAQMFIGETAYGGPGPHAHYIMAGVHDVVGPTVNPQPRDEDAIIYLNEQNSPANLRRIMEFYNKKEIRLETHMDGPNGGHAHAVILRYAGKNIDKMGRPVTAGLFTEGLKNAEKYAKDAEEAKKKMKDAECRVDRVMQEALEAFKELESKKKCKDK